MWRAGRPTPLSRHREVACPGRARSRGRARDPRPFLTRDRDETTTQVGTSSRREGAGCARFECRCADATSGSRDDCDGANEWRHGEEKGVPSASAKKMRTSPTCPHCTQRARAAPIFLRRIRRRPKAGLRQIPQRRRLSVCRCTTTAALDFMAPAAATSTGSRPARAAAPPCSRRRSSAPAHLHLAQQRQPLEQAFPAEAREHHPARPGIVRVRPRARTRPPRDVHQLRRLASTRPGAPPGGDARALEIDVRQQARVGPAQPRRDPSAGRRVERALVEQARRLEQQLQRALALGRIQPRAKGRLVAAPGRSISFSPLVKHA